MTANQWKLLVIAIGVILIVGVGLIAQKWMLPFTLLLIAFMRATVGWVLALRREGK